MATINRPHRGQVGSTVGARGAGRLVARRFVASGCAVLAVGGLLGTFAPTASAAVPAGWSTVANDAFTRTLQGGWGSADLGGDYTVTQSSSTLVGTSGSSAFATIGSGKGVTAALKSVAATDVQVSDSTALSAASDTTFDVQHGWSVRQQLDGSAYSARLRVASTGKASLGVTRVNGAVSTWLSGITLPFTVKVGQTVHGELQVTGSSPVQILVRAWVDGAPLPDWQVSYADDSSAQVTGSGSVTVADFVNSSTADVTVSHDDLSVATSDTGAGDPVREVRGSLPVGQASYPVPTAAIYVNSASGNDTNVGTISSPFKTVGAAAAKAKTGATLVLRGGTYHESVTVASNKTMTIENYPGEAVWFDGSVPVTSWAKAGSTWVTSGWTHEFSSMMGADAAFKARFIGTNAMAANPDQVFLDGIELKQVASASAVVAGTFYVSDSANTITIGSDPSGKSVRASDLAQAVFLSGPSSVIQGIGVRRYANGYEKGGAIRLGNTGGTIRNVVINDVATIGLSLSNSGKVIDHVTIQRAGLLGIGGTQNDNSVLSNSVVSNNNTENFKNEPVAGGMKFTSARTLRIDNVDASNNNGSGIWCDVSSYDLTIVNNTANGNTKHGIEMEISDKAIIANNQAINGGEDGIILFDAGNVRLFNNEVGGSSLFGIKLAQDQRRQDQLGSFPEARDPRFKNVVDPTVPWITQNIQVSNNVFGNSGYFQLYALDGRTNRAVDTWNVSVEGNLFNKRAVKTDPSMVAWGKGDNVTLERYETPGLLATAKGSSWVNAQIDSSKSITSMGADKTTFAASAVALPADVAAATDLPTGAHLLGVH